MEPGEQARAFWESFLPLSLRKESDGAFLPQFFPLQLVYGAAAAISHRQGGKSDDNSHVQNLVEQNAQAHTDDTCG